MDGEIFLVIIGVILILTGVVTTPLYQSFGSTAFWVGAIVLLGGIIAVILRSR